jgi:hypothetical protein
MYGMATSGRHPVASMYWLDTRAHWKRHSSCEQQAIAPPPFIVARDDAEKKP